MLPIWRLTGRAVWMRPASDAFLIKTLTNVSDWTQHCLGSLLRGDGDMIDFFLHSVAAEIKMIRQTVTRVTVSCQLWISIIKRSLLCIDLTAFYVNGVTFIYRMCLFWLRWVWLFCSEHPVSHAQQTRGSCQKNYTVYVFKLLTSDGSSLFHYVQPILLKSPFSINICAYLRCFLYSE